MLDLEQMQIENDQKMAVEVIELERFAEVEKMFLKVEYCFQDIRNNLITMDKHIGAYMTQKLKAKVEKIMDEESSSEEEVPPQTN